MYTVAASDKDLKVNWMNWNWTGWNEIELNELNELNNEVYLSSCSKKFLDPCVSMTQPGANSAADSVSSLITFKAWSNMP